MVGCILEAKQLNHFENFAWWQWRLFWLDSWKWAEIIKWWWLLQNQVVFADDNFKRKYHLQLESIRCWTEANDYHLLIPVSDDLDRVARETFPETPEVMSHVYQLWRHIYTTNDVTAFPETFLPNSVQGESGNLQVTGTYQVIVPITSNLQMPTM